MSDYDIYPAVDETYNFPPAIRTALSQSPELDAKINADFKSKVTPEINKVVDTTIVNREFISAGDTRVFRALGDNTGWSVPFTDSLGNIVAGVDDKGVFRAAQGVNAPPLISSRTKLACIGDSLVYGYQGTTPSDSWPQRLAAKFPNVEVINGGGSGATIDEIRFRNGSLPLYIEFPGGQISGTTTKLKVTQKIGVGLDKESSLYGTVEGTTIKGSAIRSADGTWRFDRAIPVDDPYTVPTTKLKLIREDFYPNHTAIYWMGRNDVSLKAVGSEGDVVKHVVGSIQGAVNHLSAQEKQFGVVSIVNMAAERRGSVNHGLIVEINRRLEELYPSNFIDIRKWLVTTAITDAKLTPTAADLKAMEEDAPPPQIMDGGSHPLIFMIPLIADKMEEYLNAKGYM